MSKDYFSINSKLGSFFIYKPIETENPKGILLVSHGLAEHSQRYYKLCKFMHNHNIQTYVINHLGHGPFTDKLGVWPENGFFECVNNMDSLVEYIKKTHPNKKISLLGHSMGSFMSLGYIEKYGEKIDLCILSGTNDSQPALTLMAGKLISSIISIFNDRDKASKLLDNMSFGSFNKKFAPNRTKFDWLSKDNKEVDKYINDPLCGFISSAGLFHDFLDGLSKIYSKTALSGIPPKLPIYITSGSDDPVGNFGKGPKSLSEKLVHIGISNVDIKLYENNRHECINETNADTVLKDIYNVIEKTLN